MCTDTNAYRSNLTNHRWSYLSLLTHEGLKDVHEYKCTPLEVIQLSVCLRFLSLDCLELKFWDTERSDGICGFVVDPIDATGCRKYCRKGNLCVDFTLKPTVQTM